MKVEGRVAIITGGGHGLGRDLALGFADAGADLSLCGTNAAALESTLAEHLDAEAWESARDAVRELRFLTKVAGDIETAISEVES